MNDKLNNETRIGNRVDFPACVRRRPFAIVRDVNVLRSASGPCREILSAELCGALSPCIDFTVNRI